MKIVCAAIAVVAFLGAPFATAPAAVVSQGVAPSLDSALHWRSIGPYRGGRAVAVAGVAGDARTAYFGAVGGGVWKSEDAGRTWKPIMDSQPVSSIGAVAVAPSDPKTVYVGSGEADMRSDIIHGNGMYRSTDAGATWTPIGLEDSRQIGRILVDPRDSRILLVAALGHAYGPNQTRGVYRSIDGGATWTRTLFRDADTGAIDLASDPAEHVIFASLWQTRRPPWSVYPPSYGPGSGLYRSTDGGLTWNPVRGSGFPSEGLGKIGIAVAPNAPNRIYAIVDATAGGLYRSDDGGVTWRLADKDRRIWERGWYFCHVVVDPHDPDVVYVSDTSVYRSTDGGAHFTAIKGSPSGDDFHQLWIDPADSKHLILGSDQGTTVSLNGGVSWSSWFNQPTGQFYHVATDDAFPYHLYGAQQDSGAAMIVSRSDRLGIGSRDWRPISPGGEAGYVLPDPLNPNLIYGGTVSREDLRTNQTRAISPTTSHPGAWRDEWTLPLAFGPDHALYFSRQVVFRTTDGGERWQVVSGDLTRLHPGVPATLDEATAKDRPAPEARGVVYAIAPSPLLAKVVWVGTDDGLVKLTIDGARTWHDVTPPGVTPWSHVVGVEASHFDARSAYVAIDRHRLDDDRPYVYVTHDAGHTWREASGGIPDGSFVNAVREDPERSGLLYAGTETGVYASFDDGASWQSLRLNMPFVSVRDLSVHNGDLAIATHGRGFWILDDLAPLRQMACCAATMTTAHFFPVRDAIRTRPGNDEAENSPPEVPLGENPPNGAFIAYVIPAGARGPLQLWIEDAHGQTVRRWSSDDPVRAADPGSVPYPAYWIEQVVPPPAEPGIHRFVWDFRERRPDGPLAPPGRYVVHMTLRGSDHRSTRFLLKRDPRVHATDEDLEAQAELALEVDTALLAARAQMASASGEKLVTLRAKTALLSTLERSIESADARPTPDERATWRALRSGALRGLPQNQATGSDDD
jgi:photosystem II stability/assembly factor-like uncharacterized protein